MAVNRELPTHVQHAAVRIVDDATFALPDRHERLAALFAAVGIEAIDAGVTADALATGLAELAAAYREELAADRTESLADLRRLRAEARARDLPPAATDPAVLEAEAARTLAPDEQERIRACPNFYWKWHGLAGAAACSRGCKRGEASQAAFVDCPACRSKTEAARGR